MSTRTVASPAVVILKTPCASWSQLHRPSSLPKHRQRQHTGAPPAAWPFQQAVGHLSKFITQTDSITSPLRLTQQGTDTTGPSAAQSAAAAVDPQSLPQIVTATSPPRSAAEHQPNSQSQQYVKSNVTSSWSDQPAEPDHDVPAAAKNARIPSITWLAEPARISPDHGDVSQADVDRSDTQPHHSWRCVADWSSSKETSDRNTASKVDEGMSDQQSLDTMDGSSSSTNSSSSSTGKRHSDKFVTHAASINHAKHLSNVTNSNAATSARLESATWLILQTQRWWQQQLLLQQKSTKNSSTPSYKSSSSSSSIWTDNTEGLQLLDLIYNIGQAVADLGVTAGLHQPPLDHVGRVILAEDCARILDRYYEVHGDLLTEKFWSQLENIDLQARAIHISTTLDTRRTVHKLLLDQLTNNIGQGMLLPAAAAAAGPTSSNLAAPLASAVTNNNIIVNRTDVSSSQSSELAATQAAAATSSSAAVRKDTGSSSSRFGLDSILPGFVSLGGAFLLLWAATGKAVKLIVTIVVFAKDLLLRLLLLRSVAAAAKAVAAAAAAALPEMQLAGALGLASKEQSEAGGPGSSRSSGDAPRLEAQPVSAAAPKAAAAARPALGASPIALDNCHGSGANAFANCHPAAAAAAESLQVEAVGGNWLTVPDQLQAAVTSNPALVLQSDNADNMLEMRSTQGSDHVGLQRLLVTPGCLGMLAMHPFNTSIPHSHRLSSHRPDTSSQSFVQCLSPEQQTGQA